MLFVASSDPGLAQNQGHLGRGSAVVGAAFGGLGQLQAEGVTLRIILEGRRIFFRQRGGVGLLVELEDRGVVDRLLGQGKFAGQQDEENGCAFDHGVICLRRGQRLRKG